MSSSEPSGLTLSPSPSRTRLLLDVHSLFESLPSQYRVTPTQTLTMSSPTDVPLSLRLLSLLPASSSETVVGAILTVLGLVLTTFLAYGLSVGIYNLYFHPLAEYPGPFLWRASSLPWKIALLRGTMHHDLMRFHETYGDALRLKPDELSYANAQAWKDIHAHVPGRPEFLKDPIRLPLAPNGVMSILVSDTKNHARFRSLFGHAFSDKGLRVQEKILCHYANLFVQVLKEVADTGKSLVFPLKTIKSSLLMHKQRRDGQHVQHGRLRYHWSFVVWGVFQLASRPPDPPMG